MNAKTLKRSPRLSAGTVANAKLLTYPATLEYQLDLKGWSGRRHSQSSGCGKMVGPF